MVAKPISKKVYNELLAQKADLDKSINDVLIKISEFKQSSQSEEAAMKIKEIDKEIIVLREKAKDDITKQSSINDQIEDLLKKKENLYYLTHQGLTKLKDIFQERLDRVNNVLQNSTIIQITKEAYNNLKIELKTWEEKQAKNIVAIQQARELGDLSENAEYHSALEEQENINKNIERIQNTLDYAEIVSDDVRSKIKGIRVGSKVTCENIKTKTKHVFKLTNTFDINPAEGIISILSPIGKALLSKNEGETVCVYGVAKPYWLKIVKID